MSDATKPRFERLLLGDDELSCIEVDTRSGWRVAIRHRDEDDEPWTGSSGADAYLTEHEFQALASMLTERFAAASTEETPQ